ncbi:MAG: glycerol-3-phosphate dehydrogenase/oxidase [Ferruginibacter sp.]
MKPVNRDDLVTAISNVDITWDIVVVGGGATGLGTALDAAARGYKTLLLEQADFAKGTSSRSTKLVHGGVRYLAQGNIGLVKEALYERGLLLKNAPHLVQNASFIIPNYQWWQGAFYTIGLSIYDTLAGKLGFGRARHISKKTVIEKLPNINQHRLRGGVIYQDGQFDDSRLAINLAQTCLEQGATVLNYFQVVSLSKNEDAKINGLVTIDIETGIRYPIKAKTVVNATGVFVDDLLKMDNPGKNPIVRPSQGVHLVVDRSFMTGTDAMMIPGTEDGRVLFAVPWHDKLIIGTTDTPLDKHSLEPRALPEEIDFILRTAEKYLTKAPTRKDVLSIFAGLRPLAASGTDASKTKEISRSHKIFVSASGLVSITGGKWTTYRKMAEDAVDTAIIAGKLPNHSSNTINLSIHGSKHCPEQNNHLYVYGSDKDQLLGILKENENWAQRMHPNLPFTAVEVIWGVRYEMARNVEDILARRVRALFMDARAAIDLAPMVASLLAGELGKDKNWEIKEVDVFTTLARGYLLEPYPLL